MIVIAHNIRSLHNVGSVFRSADVFDAEHIYLTGYTGIPPRKEIAKTALGSEHRVKWTRYENVIELLEQLKKDGYRIIALETGEGSISLNSLESTDKDVVILGNEVEGIEKDVIKICDVIAEIPMQGQKKSLNVSVAAGIAMFAIRSQTR
jgi:tRNA G18 (ribose-2'-O)-methylase SpoU